MEHVGRGGVVGYVGSEHVLDVHGACCPVIAGLTSQKGSTRA